MGGRFKLSKVSFIVFSFISAYAVQKLNLSQHLNDNIFKQDQVSQTTSTSEFNRLNIESVIYDE